MCVLRCCRRSRMVSAIERRLARHPFVITANALVLSASPVLACNTQFITITHNQCEAAYVRALQVTYEVQDDVGTEVWCAAAAEEQGICSREMSGTQRKLMQLNRADSLEKAAYGAVQSGHTPIGLTYMKLAITIVKGLNVPPTPSGSGMLRLLEAKLRVYQSFTGRRSGSK